MDIEKFLERFVEGYLFKDLDTLTVIEPTPPSADGAVGYPMMLTCVAGIELLGALLAASQFRVDAGVGAFVWYWNRWLGQVDSKYTAKNLGSVVRSLVRNPLAHTYITAPGIYVTKRNRSQHLSCDWQKLVLIIDCDQLAEDLKGSYYQGVRPIVDGKSLQIGNLTISRASMQKRLDEIAQVRSDQTHKLFSDLRQSRQAGLVPPTVSEISYVRANASSSGTLMLPQQGPLIPNNSPGYGNST